VVEAKSNLNRRGLVLLDVLQTASPHAAADAVDVLSRVDSSDAGVDADRFEVGLERCRHRFDRWAVKQDLEAELRAILGEPHQRSLDKAITELDEYCIAHIARSPFLLIASSDAAGNFDVSPKGDPAGFVRVLDSRTLLIPDRPGNRRADTFTNVLQNPNVLARLPMSWRHRVQGWTRQ